MAKIVYADRALDDLERLSDFLRETDPAAALETVDLIIEAVNILRRHPLIGRPVESNLRELVVSRGATGYVALYSIEADSKGQEAVLVLTVRHQREAGYGGVGWFERHALVTTRHPAEPARFFLQAVAGLKLYTAPVA